MLFWSARHGPDTPVLHAVRSLGAGQSNRQPAAPEYSLVWVQLTEGLFSLSTLTE